MTSNERLPVLTEDGISLDYQDAQYDVDLVRRGNKAELSVEHRIPKAHSLGEAIVAERAQFAAELRSPRSLYSREYLSTEPTQVVRWEPSDVRHDATYLLAGIVAIDDVDLDAAELHPLMRPEADAPGSGDDNLPPVRIPRAWWAAKAVTRRLNPLLNSLVTFVLDDKLEPGRMEITEQSDDAPHFRVGLASELYEAVRVSGDRNLRVAALIGVFARLPNSTMGKDGEHREHPITKELMTRLEERGISDWLDDDYDAAHAATAMESFSSQIEDGDPDE